MRPHGMTLRTLVIGLLLLGVSRTDSISASTDGKPLPGSDVALRQAVQKAEAIAVGREFRVLMGGGSAVAVYLAEANIAECLKGDLPRGPLRFNSVQVRHEEKLPVTNDGKGKDDGYLLFMATWEKNGQRGHKVIKMLRATEENVRSVRNLLPRP